jgi:hypothetical protein
MSCKLKLCDVCHEPITPLGGVAITMKTGPVEDTAVYNTDFPSTDFMILCRKNYHTDDEFIAAGYLPPEWVRSLPDLLGTPGG